MRYWQVPTAGSLVLMLYAPVDVVVFAFPVTFVHAPLTFFWSWMVAPAIAVPSVVLRVPFKMKGLLMAVRDGALTVRVVAC